MFEKRQTLWELMTCRERERPHIVITDDGAALFDGTQEAWRFRWSDVTRVEAYKLDHFTYDTICLDFSVDVRQLTYRTDDEMLGFDELCGHLSDYFPSVAEDWWSQVAFPAFATNHTVLYVKDRRANNCVSDHDERV